MRRSACSASGRAVAPPTQSLAVGIGRVYTAEDGTDTCGPDRINLLAIRPSFGGVPRDAVEAIIDAQGIIAAVRAPEGSAIAQGGRVLQCIDDGARWLSATLRPGQTVAVTHRLLNAEGNEIPLGPGLYAVNGGPTLLVDSAEVDADHAAEGWGNADMAGVPFAYANG